jgi:hypothetical protein
MKKLLLIGFLLASTFATGQTIYTDSVLQTSTCAGGNVFVPYSTTGSFSGQTFTAQLSDAFGGWSNPVDIGWIPFNLGIIPAQIPTSTTFGFLYRIRVVSSGGVIGSDCPNIIIITSLAQLTQITVNPNDTACEGDTITLSTLLPGNAYAWNTSESTQEIKVTSGGQYSVTVTDLLNCETADTIDVFFENCNTGVSAATDPQLIVFPNPTSGTISLTDRHDHIEVYDVFGQLRLSTSGRKVDLANLPSGLYLLYANNRRPIKVIKE